MLRRNKSSLAVVAPASPDRIERTAIEYKQACQVAAEAEARKRELSAKLLRMTRAVARRDSEGKMRAETDSYKLQIIDGTNTVTDDALLLKQGVPLKVIRKAHKTTKYQYVGVYAKTTTKLAGK